MSLLDLLEISSLDNISKNKGFKNSRAKFTTNTVSAANIDDKDEYLNIKETTNQVNINNKLIWIDNAISIPK